MNNQRRARLAEAAALISQALEILTELEAEEREAFEALPEGLAASDRGQKLEENADSLNDAICEIENAICLIADL